MNWYNLTRLPDNETPYPGYSRRTRIAIGIAFALVGVALALLVAWLPWYFRLAALLVGLSGAVYAEDHRVRKKAWGSEFTLHHFFELPAFFFLGIYVGHDLPWFEIFILLGLLALIVVVNDYLFARTHGQASDPTGSLFALKYFLVPLFIGFAVGLLVLLL